MGTIGERSIQKQRINSYIDQRRPTRNNTRTPSNEWYRQTKLGKECNHDTHCENCKPNGDCDSCDTIDGRWIEAVNQYASTCDGCGELTMHITMTMDKKTQLGYCEKCQAKHSPHDNNISC
jgi:hypothetical protein